MNIKEKRYMPIGKVEIEDVESGEIVYKTHNMIVESGRKLIINSIFGNTALAKDNFRAYYEFDNEQLTDPAMEYSDDMIEFDPQFVENDKNLYLVNASYSDSTLSYDEANVDSEKINIKIDIKLQESSDYSKLTVIGLYYKNENENILFSRALIDPVYLRTNRLYIAHYTLYF